MYPVRVYYEDTDAGGLVYHASYLRFAERARTEMLRVLGVDHATLRHRHGVTIVVGGIEARFLKPAVLDDALEVLTCPCHLRGARLVLRQEIRRPDACLATLNLTLACVTPDGRPRRWPRPAGEALVELLRPCTDTEAPWMPS